MKSYEKIQIKMLGNDELDPEMIKQNLFRFFDMVLTPKMKSKRKKNESSENHKIGLVDSEDKLLE